MCADVPPSSASRHSGGDIMDAANFFYILFVVFFVAIGGIVLGALVFQTRPAKSRAAKARTRAATARKAAAPNADVRPAGVGIEGVRADGFTAVPDSDGVIQPSGLGQQRKAATSTERSKLFWDFWEQFLNRVSAEHPGWTKRKTPTRASRYDLPTGTSAVSYSTAFTHRGLGVQLYFSSPDPRINSARFEGLRAIKDEFERALGQVAEWDEKPGRKAAAICVTSQFDDVADVDLWPAMLDWALDQHERFRQAVEAVGGLGRLKQTMPSLRLAQAG
ncbi:hypothetical protein A5753_08595 [Mycobacterium sp. 852002-51971_SCH5477799-a]|nr:hypothetical protein A5753_08595 [Mycobacterium sp. 852002-51971_SCH5477799-a]